MPETSRAQCPACGANIADDGRSKVIECSYCRTKVTLRREPLPPPPLPKPRPTRGRAWRIEEPERPEVKVELSPAFEDEARATATMLRTGWSFVFLVAGIAGALVYLGYFLVATDFGSHLAPWEQESTVALIPAGIVAVVAGVIALVYRLLTD